MTSTVFTSGGYKLDAGKGDHAKPQARTPESFAGLRREQCDYVLTMPPAVLGNINNSSVSCPHSHQQGKPKVPGQGQAVVACRPGGQQPLGLGEGQEENWVAFATQQTSLTSRPMMMMMGGDAGSPVRSKTLLGQNSSHKVDSAVLNSSRSSREEVTTGGGMAAVVVAAAASSLQEGKRGGVRKSPGHSAAQNSCIRQILFLQLELIDQQQQQLQNKNQEIDDLKAEKETLLARIERMERRLQVVKKEGPSEPKPARTPVVHTQEDRGSTPWTPEGQGGSVEERSASTTPRTLNFGRGGKGHKRRFLFQDPRAAKRRAQAKSALQREALVPKDELLDRPVTEEEGGSPSSSSSGSAHIEEPQSYLSTTDMYLCRWHQPPPSPSRELPPKKEESVAIPSWRERTMDLLDEYEAADIKENMDDSVFLKRHTKHELDEKRRKRWDIQRIREQRMFQRLQQRMDKRKGIQEIDSTEVVSFFPEAEDVEALIVTPHLPVVAFGRPLPKLTRRSFDLPWLDERSRCRVEVSKKQTPHRTCRK